MCRDRFCWYMAFFMYYMSHIEQENPCPRDVAQNLFFWVGGRSNWMLIVDFHIHGAKLCVLIEHAAYIRAPLFAAAVREKDRLSRDAQRAKESARVICAAARVHAHIYKYSIPRTYRGWAWLRNSIRSAALSLEREEFQESYHTMTPDGLHYTLSLSLGNSACDWIRPVNWR